MEILVNNAGFGDYGPFVEANLATTLQMLQLNIVTLTHLTRLFLPGLVQRNAGGILNVASTAAFQPGPLMAVYYASKAYVLHFSEALAEELRTSKVRVTALCPGPTATGFEGRAGLEASKLFTGTRSWMPVRWRRLATAGCCTAGVSVIPGLWNNLLVQSLRLFPRRLVASIMRQIQERRKT